MLLSVALLAGAGAGQFLAMRLDPHAHQLRLEESEAAGDAVVQQGHMLVLKLHHPVTIQADEVVVLRFVEEIGVVVDLIASEVHLPQQPALHEEGQRPIDGGPGNGAVDLPGFVEEFLGLEVLVTGEGCLHNHIPLLGPPQALAGEVCVEALSDPFVHEVSRG